VDKKNAINVSDIKAARGLEFKPSNQSQILPLVQSRSHTPGGHVTGILLQHNNAAAPTPLTHFFPYPYPVFTLLTNILLSSYFNCILILLTCLHIPLTYSSYVLIYNFLLTFMISYLHFYLHIPFTDISLTYIPTYIFLLLTIFLLIFLEIYLLTYLHTYHYVFLPKTRVCYCLTNLPIWSFKPVTAWW
jgi:hypothetical protein